MAERPLIFDLDPDALREHLVAWGLHAFRAKQVVEWVYKHGVNDPQQMTNLSVSDRAVIADHLCFASCQVVQSQLATDDVRKLLVDWDAGVGQTECVMIPVDGPSTPRRTACISSQVGCAVGCRFCASGLGGLDGNLSAGQIVEQVWLLDNALADDPVGRITNVVFMGMGEPLTNFDNVVRAVRTLTADWAFNLSSRRVTISTVGLPAQIRRLADERIPATLAISLHAPNDDVRRQLIPWADYVTIDQLVDAGRYYFDRTGREVTLEYTLMREVNDRPDHARELVGVCKRLRCNVNLIRYNEVAGLPYRRPVDHDVLSFQKSLRNAGVNCHIRASRGCDIAAACGQLRHETTAVRS